MELYIKYYRQKEENKSEGGMEQGKQGQRKGRGVLDYEYILSIVVVSSLSHVWLFCDSMDCSPPGSSVHGIFQARILEWVAIYFFRGPS